MPSKVLFVFTCLALVAAPVAKASYLEPKACKNISDAEMLAVADIAGDGQVIAADCQCAEPLVWSYDCTATVKITKPKKGRAGSITYRTQPLTDAPYKEQCLWYKKEIKQEIGIKKAFYFKKTEYGFVEVSSQKCVYK